MHIITFSVLILYKNEFILILSQTQNKQQYIHFNISIK